MTLFLIIGPLLFFAAFLSVEIPEALGSTTVWKAFFAGIGAFLISLPFLVIYFYFVDVYFTPHGIFMYHWINDFLLPLVFGFSFFFLFFRKMLVYGSSEYNREAGGIVHAFVYTRDNLQREAAARFFAYWAGFLALTPLITLLQYFRWLDSYTLFIVPFSRIILIMVCGMLVSIVYFREGYARFLLLLLVFPGTAALTLVPLYYYTNQRLSSYLIAGALVAGGFLGYLFFRGVYLTKAETRPRYSLNDI